MKHKPTTLLLIVIVLNFNSNSAQGNEWSCRVDSGSPVTLQATQFGANFSGHFNVSASCTQKLLCLLNTRESRDMAICAELPSMQALICPALGLQYAGDYWSENSHLSECYSMKYQQGITKGRGAGLACYTPSYEDTLLNISNEETVTITFSLSTNNDKEQPQALDHTRLGFMMQVNRSAGDGAQNTMTTICVYALLNISRCEWRDQIVAFFNTGTSLSSSNCNFTVNLTISSQTVMEICAGNLNVPTFLPAAVITEVTKGQEEQLKCNSRGHLVKELVLGLVILVLFSLVIVLGSMVIYTYCKARYPKRFSRSHNSTLLSNHYTDSNSQLASADYIQMKMDPMTTAEDTNSHMTCSESSGHGGGTCEEAEAKYDELKDCSQRRIIQNGGNYSRLTYK